MRYPLLFIVLLIGVSYYYQYDEILFKRPQSIHDWRQADCASLALNYYQGGMDFFHPQVHNLTSDNFTTGYASTSEMPILYYTVATLYHLFGYREFLFRLVNLLIFLTGLFYLYKLFYKLVKHQFWAMMLPLLIFTSPVLVYYANNFLSNSAALGVVFIGWYHFMEFYRTKNTSYFKRSVIFFTIAGLLKVTALLSVGAIVGVFILEKLFKSQRHHKEKIFQYGWRNFLVLVGLACIVGSWLLYASYYNQSHTSTYFSTTTFPIWAMSSEEAYQVASKVLNRWSDDYFSYSMWTFLFIACLVLLLAWNRVKPFFRTALVLLIGGAWTFILLQYATLQDHDYYTINLFIIPVLVLVAFFGLLVQYFPMALSSKVSMVLFAAFTLYNIHYARGEVGERYMGKVNNYGVRSDLDKLAPYLRSIGISKDDPVISIPDQSHVSLYLMNQKGWTEYAERFFNKGNTVYLNRDANGIEASIGRGAEYLIIDGIDELYLRPFLHKFAAHKLGQFGEVLIFDLTEGKKQNFALPNRRVREILVCNAELVNPEGSGYNPLHGSYLFGNASTKSDEFHYSGQYSAKLTSEDPFGMTLHLDHVSYGESYIVSVMRRKGGEAGQLIAAGDNLEKFYLNEYAVKEVENSDWEMLEMEFHIPKEMNNHNLSIYLWNPDTKPVFFDDLKIVRFHSYFR